MSAGANLLVDYYDAKPDARIRLIFRNYVNFEHLLDLYGKAISSKIIAAKNGRHRNTADVMHFYLHLINVDGLALGTLDSVHCVLHPTFELAVRDDIIRKNPSDGVMREISKKSGKNRGIRRALTPEQQRAFMEYMVGHPIFYHWWPLFTILLGTGCRIGECLGLRWEDLDFENKVISINHAVTYYRSAEHGRQLMSISLPKTEAGIRTIPMLDVVKEAFLMEKEQETFEGLASKLDNLF